MKIQEKKDAIVMRKNGASLKEISDALNVSKGSVSVWVRDVALNKKARQILKNKKINGQKKSSKALKERTKKREKEAYDFAVKTINRLGYVNLDEQLALLAVYYWCEGNKSPKDMVFFTNSDPNIIKAFLRLLRNSFELEENRFRVCIHLHDYHIHKRELLFWSKTTNIPLSQFIAPYQKPHTGKQKREGYRGCAQIRYYDVSVARKLLALGKELTRHLGSIS